MVSWVSHQLLSNKWLRTNLHYSYDLKRVKHFLVTRICWCCCHQPAPECCWWCLGRPHRAYEGIESGEPGHRTHHPSDENIPLTTVGGRGVARHMSFNGNSAAATLGTPGFVPHDQHTRLKPPSSHSLPYRQ